MGITGLVKLIADIAPQAIKEGELQNYFGRKVAIDASMCLYQFLIAVRSEGAQLTTVDGDTTSHLVGMFYRTIRLLENGIKPIYVFDGKPPDMKGGELLKRAERRQEAQKMLEKAEEAGIQEDVEKYNRRLVKVTKEQTNEAKELLKLMGVPFIEAPCEAEAQCAAMVKAGKVYGAATEDMDALTFGSSVLIRRLTFSEARKMPVQEITYQKVLDGLELSKESFIDLCILLGCDYCDSIKGVGPKRAIELIKEHKSLEVICDKIDKKKYTIPEDWNYQKARELFITPEIQNPEEIDLKWTEPDEEGMIKFLCGHRNFSEDRIRAGIKKIIKSKSSTTQGRLDSFFKVISVTPKRKSEDNSKSGSNKKAKLGGGKPGRKPK